MAVFASMSSFPAIDLPRIGLHQGVIHGTSCAVLQISRGNSNVCHRQRKTCGRVKLALCQKIDCCGILTYTLTRKNPNRFKRSVNDLNTFWTQPQAKELPKKLKPHCTRHAPRCPGQKLAWKDTSEAPDFNLDSRSENSPTHFGQIWPTNNRHFMWYG